MIHADLIVGADGVKSFLREVVLGEPVKAVATGDAAYRAVIPAEKMIQDPELRELLENPEMTGWMGPKKHIMAYCIVSVPPLVACACLLIESRHDDM